MKKLRGTFQPCLANPHEPQPMEALGDPPTYLARDEKAVWRELLRITVPGMLTQQDRMIAELLCVLMAQHRRREPLSSAERGQLTTLLSRMGLTPSDRARVCVTPTAKAEDGDLSQFIN